VQPVELSQYPDLDPYRAAGDPLSEAVALLEHARPRHRAAFVTVDKRLYSDGRRIPIA
jgi:hypothetical protein